MLLAERIKALCRGCTWSQNLSPAYNPKASSWWTATHLQQLIACVAEVVSSRSSLRCAFGTAPRSRKPMSEPQIRANMPDIVNTESIEPVEDELRLQDLSITAWQRFFVAKVYSARSTAESLERSQYRTLRPPPRFWCLKRPCSIFRTCSLAAQPPAAARKVCFPAALP